jgi:hypothetical protein
MRFLRGVGLIAFFATRMYASSLTFTLSPSFDTEKAYTAGTALFTGTLTDTDTANTCDGENVDCLYLNFISFSFDQDTSTSHLSPNFDQFVLNVPGSFSDDGSGSYSGIIFGINIAPNTPAGVYTGTVTISGGYDDPNDPPTLNNPLATTSFTLNVVSPEPADFGLAILGIAAIVLAKRRVAS